MRLYLLVGKEASATRLTSRLFEAAGCWSGAVDERHDDYSTRVWLQSGEANQYSFNKFLESQGLNTQPPRIVYRTHPTFNYHPILSIVADKFRIIGYEVFWVVILRRPIRWIKSVPGCDPQEVWGPFREVFRQAQPQEHILFWDNSLLFLDSDRYLQEMSFMTDLVFKASEKIKDADDRYFSTPSIRESTDPGGDIYVRVSDGVTTEDVPGKNDGG